MTKLGQQVYLQIQYSVQFLRRIQIHGLRKRIEITCDEPDVSDEE